MAIIPTWPVGLIPNSQEFYLEYTTSHFISPFTGASQTNALPVSKWRASLSFRNLDRDQLRIIEVFLMKLGGASGRFKLGDQANKIPRGIAGGLPVVRGAGQSGNFLTVEGCIPNQNFLEEGDYFSVGHELKRITTQAIVTDTGQAVLSFEPLLRNSPADQSLIITHAPTCTMRLVDDKQARTRRAAMFADVTIQAVEDIY